jgi:hypothetical protein
MKFLLVARHYFARILNKVSIFSKDTLILILKMTAAKIKKLQ